MSYDAFQTVINMGGELKNPRKNIVRGVLISMIITAAIYIMLQVTFIGAVEPSTLAKVGWHGIDFTSPFADLAIILGINWLVILLYLDAFVSPFGTGVAFVATAALVCWVVGPRGTGVLGGGAAAALVCGEGL